ncbi:MAG: ornithine carbamoyltransferase [Acidobacteriota bacterium]
MLSIAELDARDLFGLAARSVDFGTGRAAGERPLADRMVGIYFRKSSTRTRTAFTVGAVKLGADTIAYGPDDLQIVTGETLQDTARVLSGYLDLLVIRTNETMAEMRTLSDQDRMGVVNALTEDEHPTQAIADLGTILETFGRLRGLHILYLGEGNSSAASLALSVSLLPEMRMTLVTPEGYGLPAPVLERIRAFSGRSGSVIEQRHGMDDLPRHVDAVYTSRWQTMGVVRGVDGWREIFAPYKVTAGVMARVSRPQGTIFLHDLPAVRGEDVDDEVLDGPQSLAWRQAQYKQFGAMAVLEWCAGARETEGPAREAG